MFRHSDRERKRLLTAAKARITWGEAPEDVTDYLTGQGVPEPEALALAEKLVKKRSREVRSRSLTKLCSGVGMVVAAIVFFGVLPWREWMDALNEVTGTSRRRRGGPGTLLVAFVAGAGITGLWMVWRGFSGLIVPQAEELTDVE